MEEIKSSGECAEVISEAATELILSLVRPDDEWCIITTPKRRHITEYHFATDICQKIAIFSDKGAGSAIVKTAVGVTIGQKGSGTMNKVLEKFFTKADKRHRAAV